MIILLKNNYITFIEKWNNPGFHHRTTLSPTYMSTATFLQDNSAPHAKIQVPTVLIFMRSQYFLHDYLYSRTYGTNINQLWILSTVV